MITKFDKVNLRVLRADIDAALQLVADRHGIVLKLAGMTYREVSFTGRVEGAVKRDGLVMSKEVTNFRDYAELYGLKPDDLGRSLMLQGKSYRISGLNTRKGKKPVLLERDGKTYSMGAEAVSKLIAMEGRE